MADKKAARKLRREIIHSGIVLLVVGALVVGVVVAFSEGVAFVLNSTNRDPKIVDPKEFELLLDSLLSGGTTKRIGVRDHLEEVMIGLSPGSSLSRSPLSEDDIQRMVEIANAVKSHFGRTIQLRKAPTFFNDEVTYGLSVSLRSHRKGAWHFSTSEEYILLFDKEENFIGYVVHPSRELQEDMGFPVPANEA